MGFLYLVLLAIWSLGETIQVFTYVWCFANSAKLRAQRQWAITLAFLLMSALPFLIWLIVLGELLTPLVIMDTLLHAIRIEKIIVGMTLGAVGIAGAASIFLVPYSRECEPAFAARVLVMLTAAFSLAVL